MKILCSIAPVPGVLRCIKSRTPTYQPDELGQKIIFNVDCLGGWQKVSFLMGGQDYDLYHQLIGGDHGDNDAQRLARA